MEITSIRSSNLEVKEQELIVPVLSDFTTSEMAMYHAKIGAKIKEIPFNSLLNEASQIWFYIKLKWGLRSNNEMEEKASISSIQDDLLSKPYLTIAEVKKCLNMAMNGEYGESSFFSSARFRTWMQKYHDDSRIIAGKIQLAINAQNEKPKPVPTDQELKAEIIQIANKHIQQVTGANKEKMNFTWFGGLNHLFDSAFRFQLITIIPKERRVAILAQCNNDQDLAKTEIYKLWINEMAEAGYTLDENGEIV